MAGMLLLHKTNGLICFGNTGHLKQQMPVLQLHLCY
jgi:hypothetical protein